MPSSFSVSEADEDLPWDSHVESSSYACVSHLTGWIEALENLTGGKLYPLVVFKGSQIVALCPMFFFRRGPLRAAYSPPIQGLTHHMGPALVGYEDFPNRKKAQILGEVHRVLRSYLVTELGCNYIEMVHQPGLLDARPLHRAGYSASFRHTYIIDLTQGVESVWNGFSHELRRNVQKCEGQATSREASPDELSDFMRLVRHRFRDLGVKYAATEAYLSELFKSLGPSHIRLFLVEESGDMQTGIIVAMHGSRATIWHGAVRPRTSRLPVNEHLHWHVISWAEQHGFQELEIMGADNPRLDRFKSKFNAELVPCIHAEWSRRWSRSAERIGREPPSLF